MSECCNLHKRCVQAELRHLIYSARNQQSRIAPPPDDAEADIPLLTAADLHEALQAAGATVSLHPTLLMQLASARTCSACCSIVTAAEQDTCFCYAQTAVCGMSKAVFPFY